MRTSELAAALRIATPQFTLVDGAYVRLRDHFTPASIQKGIAFAKGDIKRFEHDINRFFIVADLLDHVVEERDAWAEDDLLTIADICAALVRDGLRQAFPDQQFDVEIIGRDLVDAETLELCVTFSCVR
jgi:hypothetical protein